MKTILFLDDDLNRRDKFEKKFGEDEHIWMVDNPLSAIHNIRSREYDVIFLDHDLGHDLTGTDVAWCFAQCKNIGASIMIHSINSEGAARMADILRQLGCRDIKVCPFGSEDFWWISRKFIAHAGEEA